MSKKVVALIAIAAVLVVGGFVYKTYADNQAEVKTEAKEKADLKKSYEEAKNELAETILTEEDRTALSDELSAYESKLDSLTEDETADLKSLTAKISKKYKNSDQTLEDSFQVFVAYPSDETYYSDEFKTNAKSILTELNALRKEGKYQSAYNKFTELNTSYSAYVDQVNAYLTAQAEQQAKEAAEAEAKNNTSTKSSSAKSSSSKSNTSASSGSGSTGTSSANSSNTSAGTTTPSTNSSTTTNSGTTDSTTDTSSGNLSFGQCNGDEILEAMQNGTFVPPDGWLKSE